MTKSEAKPAIAAVNELFGKSADGLRGIVHVVMQGGAGRRDDGRARGREGASAWPLGSATAPAITLARSSPGVGKLELRVPQDRDGRFSTELFERYQRSEQALVSTLAEMGACPGA
jgi:putative transposase